MKYRMAEQDDIEELTQLRIAYLLGDYKTIEKEQINRLQQLLPEYYKEHLNKDLHVYIAEEEGEIVGTAYLLVIYMPANPSFITGKIGDVLSVYTKEEYRRRGISTRLIKYLIEDAKDMELSYIKLEATKDGYPIYKKNGFKEIVNEYTSMKYLIGGDEV